MRNVFPEFSGWARAFLISSAAFCVSVMTGVLVLLASISRLNLT
jgi:hypothetical protein